MRGRMSANRFFYGVLVYASILGFSCKDAHAHPILPSSDVFDSFFGDYIETAKRQLQKNDTHYRGALAVFGGFNSCSPSPTTTELYKHASKLLWKLAGQGHYYRLVLGCFGRSSGTVYVQQTSHGDKIFKLNPSDVHSRFVEESNQTEDKRNHILGHSYGGWLAINTAIHAQNNDTPLIGLGSIDPISAKHCTSSVFAAGYIGGIWNANPKSDCTRAPRDLRDSSQSLKDSLSWWLNFFQDNSTYLHSGPMAAAQNTKIEYDYDGWTEKFKAHMDIDGDDRVWSDIEGSMMQD